MANCKQAKKRIRQTATKTEANRKVRSTMRTAVKNAETAITAGDKAQITTTFKTAMSELNSAVNHGILKQNTASRKVSRLAARIRKIAS